MSENSFPIKDLVRRKLQTSLAIISLTICVASTLFLLLFSEQIGSAMVSFVEGRLTSGFLIVLSQYTLLVVVLIFIVGVVTVSFLSYLMMSQRIKDIGLMKMAGCPNDLVFGFFMNEMLLITLAGCALGTIFGILADYVSMNLAGSLGLTIQQKMPNPWLIVLVFVVFFALSLLLGGIPVFQATNVEPTKAFSPTYHAGVSKEKGFNVISRNGVMFRMGFRNLVRHKAVSLRTLLCLTTIFILITVVIAGGMIAYSTTGSWVENAVGRNIVLIAQQDMSNQYQLLLSKFFQNKETPQFNYTDAKYAIPDNLSAQLKQIPGISIDPRLVLQMHVREIHNFTINSDTGSYTLVGDDRQGESLIIGIDPQKVVNDWSMQGTLFQKNNSQQAVIGDSLARSMFSVPLSQSIELQNTVLSLTGVCTDPINNGNVTYVPLSTLQNITGIAGPNILIVKIDAAANRTSILDKIRATVNSAPGFSVLDLNNVLNDTLSFLGHIWFLMMLAPLLSLAVACLCLVGYVMLAVSEQHQEFGVLRALGVRPKGVVSIISWQILVVLFASYAFGVAFGMMITLLILFPEPVVTDYIVIQIAVSLLAALIATFLISLYPAIRFARKPTLEVLAQP